MTQWARRREMSDHEWRMEREAAEAANCPRCGAFGRETRDVPEHCTNPITEEELTAPAHFQRLDAANELRDQGDQA